jgi:hypothetical protein
MPSTNGCILLHREHSRGRGLPLTSPPCRHATRLLSEWPDVIRQGGGDGESRRKNEPRRAIKWCTPRGWMCQLGVFPMPSRDNTSLKNAPLAAFISPMHRTIMPYRQALRFRIPREAKAPCQKVT